MTGRAWDRWWWLAAVLLLVGMFAATVNLICSTWKAVH